MTRRRRFNTTPKVAVPKGQSVEWLARQRRLDAAREILPGIVCVPEWDPDTHDVVRAPDDDPYSIDHRVTEQ